MKRWEHGSEFHRLVYQKTSPVYPWSTSCYTGSGREALRLLLSFGQKEFGWSRLWLPSYYCQEVIDSLVSIGIKVKFYNDSPLEKSLPLSKMEFSPFDVVLLINYFGLRDKYSVRSYYSNSAILIEDHTHDPCSNWAFESGADYCIASLRKTLPIPEGGVIWSPLKLPMPPTPQLTGEHQIASDRKDLAMALKKHYLEGGDTTKESYRQLQLEGEESIATELVSGMTNRTRIALDTFPIDDWREKRFQNYVLALLKLSSIKGLDVLKPNTGSCCPFSIVLVLDTNKRREYLRSKLLSNNIYPAILWPNRTELGERILSVCCDMRYSAEDMEQVSEVIISAMEDFNDSIL